MYAGYLTNHKIDTWEIKLFPSIFFLPFLSAVVIPVENISKNDENAFIVLSGKETPLRTGTRDRLYISRRISPVRLVGTAYWNPRVLLVFPLFFFPLYFSHTVPRRCFSPSVNVFIKFARVTNRVLARILFFNI